MSTFKCGCGVHDEGTNFCTRHRDLFVLAIAQDTGEALSSVYFKLGHEGIDEDTYPYDENASSDFTAYVERMTKYDVTTAFNVKATLERDNPSEPIPDGYLPGEESDGQPDAAKEIEDLETDGGGYSPALNEDASIDGASDAELDARYESEHEEKGNYFDE